MRSLDSQQGAPTDCNCGRGDWIYDAQVGMWCCGCGYVKHATGTGFKKHGWTLSKDRRVIEPLNSGDLINEMTATEIL